MIKILKEKTELRGGHEGKWIRMANGREREKPKSVNEMSELTKQQKRELGIIQTKKTHKESLFFIITVPPFLAFILFRRFNLQYLLTFCQFYCLYAAKCICAQVM